MDTLHCFQPDSPLPLPAPFLQVEHAGEIYTPHLVRIRKRTFSAETIRTLDVEREGHSHRIYHLVYILEGPNTMLVGGRTVGIRTGQVVVIDPDVYHNVIPREPRRCAFLTLMFTYGSGEKLLSIPFGQLLESLTGMHVEAETVVDDSRGAMRALFACLEQDVLECMEKDPRRATYCLAGLLNELAGLSLRRDRPTPIPQDILAARQYVLENLDRPVTIDDLTEVAHLSKSHLIAKFKQHYGRSPIDFLIHERIEKAKMYLVHSTKRVKEIARLCGFQSEYHFSKTFRKRTHVAPGQFRSGEMPPGHGDD